MSHGNSRPVSSPQRAPHPALARTLARRLGAPVRAPLPEHTVRAIAALDEWLAAPTPLVLDSGCGSGASCFELAARHPGARVLGLDRSAARLGARLTRAGDSAWPVRLARAELAAAWRLLAERGVRLAGHYLLYPNPWPKPAQLKRRWHAHPAFADLLRLGGRFELRSNWRVYVDEFALALAAVGIDAALDAVDPSEPALSPFERKYRASAHPLWRLVADLGGGATGSRSRS